MIMIKVNVIMIIMKLMKLIVYEWDNNEEK